MRARAESLISPPSGCNSPTMARSKVDLPAPLRPMRPILRPTSTCKAAPSSKARPPRRMVRSRMVRTVMDAGCGAGGGARQRGEDRGRCPRSPRRGNSVTPDPAETLGQKIELHKFNALHLAVENEPSLTFSHQQQRRKVQCVLCFRLQGLQHWSFAACS